MNRRRQPDRRDWKRQYRLSKLLWHYQTVRLDHDDAQALRALAKRKGVPVAELIRTFIAWGWRTTTAGPMRTKRAGCHDPLHSCRAALICHPKCHPNAQDRVVLGGACRDVDRTETPMLWAQVGCRGMRQYCRIKSH
jgi:hypothetical protein